MIDSPRWAPPGAARPGVAPLRPGLPAAHRLAGPGRGTGVGRAA
jgi:hypothetical protein